MHLLFKLRYLLFWISFQGINLYLLVTQFHCSLLQSNNIKKYFQRSGKQDCQNLQNIHLEFFEYLICIRLSTILCNDHAYKREKLLNLFKLPPLILSLVIKKHTTIFAQIKNILQQCWNSFQDQQRSLKFSLEICQTGHAQFPKNSGNTTYCCTTKTSQTMAKKVIWQELQSSIS